MQSLMMILIPLIAVLIVARVVVVVHHGVKLRRIINRRLRQ
jgi:hypothetical protein